MYTIATAGHIDHGKSSLVRALTGIDPDRLPEEKERQMTIELGFAHLRLSGGQEVGIIDVPGHERFIKTMISGVGAINLVMFVIAADDGWMPQSEEHLAILRYLGVKVGFFVLTKVDLVAEEWKELVKADLRQRAVGTFLEDAPIVEFSASDNRNLSAIVASIEEILGSTARGSSDGVARLYVDRVFTVAGTGTVVTGTLRDGDFRVGQDVWLHPSGAKTKIKSLESFYSHLESARSGIRLAVGLQALDRGAVQRGDLLYGAESIRPTVLLAVSLQIEPEASRYVRNNRAAIFLHGTSEVAGSIVLPPEQVLTAADTRLAVLKLETPAIAKIGDRFILRLPTPSLLIGGGIVLDCQLSSFRRSDQETWRALARLAGLEPQKLICHELHSSKLLRQDQVLRQSLIPQAVVAQQCENLLARKVIVKRDEFLILKEVWDSASVDILAAVGHHHEANPHVAAMPMAELMSRLKLPQQLVDYVLEGLMAAGKLQKLDAGIRLADHSAGLSPELESVRAQIMNVLANRAGGAATREELFALDREGKKVYTFLRQNNQIVDLGGSVYLREAYESLVAAITGAIKAKGRITVAEVRDLTGTSRKVVLPVLEELDRRRVTRREGDYRYLCE